MGSRGHATLRRAAFVAILAFASATLLPYLHAIAGGCAHPAQACDASERTSENVRSDDSGSASHSRHCAVCGALTQSKGRTLVLPRVLAITPPPRQLASVHFPPVTLVSVARFDRAAARAPPESLRFA